MPSPIGEGKPQARVLWIMAQTEEKSLFVFACVRERVLFLRSNKLIFFTDALIQCGHEIVFNTKWFFWCYQSALVSFICLLGIIRF